MKKSLYFALAASVASFASCDDENFANWVSPTQVQNAQGAVDEVTVTVTPCAAIDFATWQSADVKLATVSASAGEIKTIEYQFPAQEYIVTTDGVITAESLQSYVVSTYGRAPEARTFPVVVRTGVQYNDVTYTFVETVNITATLEAPVIETGYYLVGDMCGWDADHMLAFTHVGDGNVYDYPEFTISFETTNANQYWKIIPQSNVDAGNIWANGVLGTEVDGDESLEGFLSSNNPGAGKIAEQGKYKMTINLMNGTYVIEAVKYDPYIYFIGATDGWTNADQLLALTNADEGTYTGFVYAADPNNWGVAGKFQTVQGSWDNQINAGTFSSMTGVSGSDNIEFPEIGVYYMEVSLGNASIVATKINNMNLVGDFNGWNAADDAQQMTWNADARCWEITGAGVNTNGWKFTANNAWDINLGGKTLSELTANGDNIGVAGSTIKLYPTRTNSNNIYCTVE